MKFAAISAAAAALSLAPASGLAAPRGLSSEFVVTDGLEVTLWAESPLFYKPANIDVDQRGRIWVAEGVNYRTFRGKDLVGSSRVDLQACKLEYSIVSPK